MSIRAASAPWRSESLQAASPRARRGRRAGAPAELAASRRTSGWSWSIDAPLAVELDDQQERRSRLLSTTGAVAGATLELARQPGWTQARALVPGRRPAPSPA